MAHEPKTAPKGAKTGGEYTLALNERHKILGACNSCNWNFGLGFFPGYGFTLFVIIIKNYHYVTLFKVNFYLSLFFKFPF